MHALLAHAYHLSLAPWWRPYAATLVIAALARAIGYARTPRAAALTACIAVLVGWLVMDADSLAWPMKPVARLPGLALIVLADAAWRSGTAKRAAWWTLPVTAALAAWWLRGAPLSGPGIVNGMPVFLGLAFAFPLARRLARADAGWGSLGAALALAGSLSVVGASPHWARAALVPAVAAAILLGVRAAAPALASLLVVAAAAALVASDRGRLVPVDVACLLPLLAWPLAPRLSRGGPAVACVLVVGVCVGLAWVAMRGMGR